jgi:hypothetical protein
MLARVMASPRESGAWFEKQKSGGSRVLRILERLHRVLAPHKYRRALAAVSYDDAEALLREGWRLAPEEDRNRSIGVVFLEKIERVA